MDNCKLEGTITVKGTVSGSLASHMEKIPGGPIGISYITPSIKIDKLEITGGEHD